MTEYKSSFDEWFEIEGMRLALELYVDGLELGNVRDFAEKVWYESRFAQWPTKRI